ncbi:DE-cadherin [Anastrepha obliqua]|uniref:DE-cadherin n=1 Tax=Anastrepha obliqua TaxID=95512 RepID=UPI0024092820|nr:DE-cadherin [Anastrepha obliqua]XP_054736554.1 DE-cadherin [Anastrepha obliqua]XP_054736555.1 DE-cadherin [Anastrepha obliqua]XP_054736556.1 DE-cadherin [Anastrepha obliqua]XP_054736557.1 DE-cadherin [Anastrepha obliqua]XP_054736558.1 DE-cadherin [Anastrepha obliqua]
MLPQHCQSQQQTQIYHPQQYQQQSQRPRKHLCRKLHKYQTLAFALALVNLQTAVLVYAASSTSLSALSTSPRDDPFTRFFIPAHTHNAENSLTMPANPNSVSPLARLRRSPNPAPESVSSLYSALPAARTGNSAIYFGMSPSSLAAHENSVNQIEQYSDNRKPAFKNCASYKPSVKEERPENTFVIMVQAEDPDSDQEIKYSLVQSAAERSKFHIDPKTGVIVTAHIFDRDEPIYEKAVYVTVQATDNGRPPLDDVCTFKVTIEDINDNPPVFNKARYDESMSEDKQPDAIVMRISASDLDDGNNSIVEYEILPDRDHLYFKIDKAAGIIYLNRPIDKRPGQHYTINVRAYNSIVPDPPQDAQIEVRIRVVESSKKPPSFVDPIEDPIYLKEDYMNYSTPIVTLRAVSNVPDKPEVIFELITGRTEQTNSKKTFVFDQTGTTVTIGLGKLLDYESVTEYTLTMSARNTYDLVAEHVVKIKVEDVNDNIPYFTEVKKGTLLENEPPGTPVMQVRAFDMDGTEANNIVSFELADNREYFKIDPHTGNITALTTFDREERDFYNVKVIASDNSPSSLFNNGEPNRGQQVFRIEIADKNDHKPIFQLPEYVPDRLPEDANINFVVIEVMAEDEDNASQILYTIESGNVGNAFKIEEKTGTITVNQRLDYENITEYLLKIRAFDGIYDDYAIVKIEIADVNDNPPEFKEKYSKTIQEEMVYDYCILNIEAYDPDIKNRSADQHIKYSVVKEEQKKMLTIDNEGCLKLIKPLDRDPPDGHKSWQVLIAAVDEDGFGLKSVTHVIINLQDINDNAPFLVNTMPVIWQENRNPGQVVQLQANDYDEPQNGPPYTYGIDSEASADIKAKFSIDNDYLFANVQFDREEQKEYFIPIRISDSGQPKRSMVSILHLIIGDDNDNAMSEGSSRIFIYNYKGEAPDTDVGRVFVDDPDDWDLEDKEFRWKNGIPHDNFRLNPSTGMITMLERTQEGEYLLEFVVTEESTFIPRHSVDADVTIIVRELPEEAVDKSGSIRFFNITKEQFIAVARDAQADDSLSLKDRLQYSLAKLFNTSVTNVDVFTVLQNTNNTLDVRYSAHGSPYYAPEKLNGIVAQHQQMLEKELGLQMLMVNIDECLIERHKCESSCMNTLHKSNIPYMIYSNTSSFVGVTAFIEWHCVCEARISTYCLNGGTPRIGENDMCDCIDGFTGPHCELVSVGFYGNGYAFYEPISPCENTKISLEVAPQTDQGLIMYLGPLNYNPLLPLSDFLSLELVKGYPTLTVDYGSGAIRIEHRHIQLQVGKSYQLDIILQKASIEMTVDNCRLSTCMSLGAPQGPNEFLNVNAPLQLGGTPVDLLQLGYRLNWTYTPSRQGFFGCIRNLTINNHTYNLGAPAISRNIDSGCQRAVAVAVSFGIDRNFIIAIVACIMLLLIILLAVVVQKKQKNGWHEKDIDDIRETIINYEDEGGGERDTDYDLNVLRTQPFYEEKLYKDPHALQAIKDPNNEIPDIGGFLGDKKENCDREAGTYPVDDVRHYAYEGDGNSDGSLSSLASCTDDGDLNFDYLSNFGPRFRKLADMYGEEPSDTDSNVDDEQGWRI